MELSPLIHIHTLFGGLAGLMGLSPLIHVQIALTWGRSSILGAWFWAGCSIVEGVGLRLSSEVGQSVRYSVYMP